MRIRNQISCKKVLIAQKKYWRTAKNCMPKSSNTGSPIQLNIDISLFSKSSQIAMEINKYFINQVNFICEAIPNVFNTLAKCYYRIRRKKVQPITQACDA